MKFRLHHFGWFIPLLLMASCSGVSFNFLKGFSAPSMTCPDQPTGVLTHENIQAIEFKDQKSAVSGEVTAQQDRGYRFQATAGHKLTYSINSGVCVKFFTPRNQPLSSNDFSQLPITGMYTAQVYIPGGSATYDFKLDLVDPQVATASPSPDSPSPTPSPQKTPSCTERADEAFHAKYPDAKGQLIDEDDYQRANEWVKIRNGLSECQPVAPYLKGKWYGKYSGNDNNLVLTITEQKGAEFEGTLAVAGERKIAIAGKIQLDTRAITFRETRVLSEDQNLSEWLLGTNSGELSSNFLTMEGTGEDRNNKYDWQFSRTQ